MKHELKRMDDFAVEDAFYRDLEFGTGGLRGTIGAGTNRMNVYVVARASQGLSSYLNSGDDVKEGCRCLCHADGENIRCFRTWKFVMAEKALSSIHGVKGISDLHIMEVQIGQELSEADIERSKDQN